MTRGGNLLNRSLLQLHDAFVANRSEDSRRSCTKMDRAHAANVRALAERGIIIMPELVDALPHLPSALRDFGIWWISVNRFRDAEKVLLRLLHDDDKRRLACAAALSSIGGKKSEREFIRIAKFQLATESPDCEWLDAVIQGLRFPNSPEAEEVLLSIFASKALPGWLRGNAGDAMSGCSQLNDRRTNFYRRALSSAADGLLDDDIDLQFWSMFVIASLAQNDSSNSKRSNHGFASILPRLREIAATDHRLAPGFWWPMSAEAEDAICVIAAGSWPELDAGDRWRGNSVRGTLRHI